jgi:hypothetical protein
LVSNRKNTNKSNKIFLHFLFGVEFYWAFEENRLGLSNYGILKCFFASLATFFSFICREVMHGISWKDLCYEMKRSEPTTPTSTSIIHWMSVYDSVVDEP